MKEPNVKTLLEVLKGEEMAAEIYSTVLSTIENREIKQKLNQIAGNHKNHTTILSEQIIKMGGRPDSSTGMGGWMANTKMKLQGIVSNDEKILKELHNGEKQGVKLVNEIVKGDLDDSSRAMVQQMMDTDKGHIKELEEMINRYRH